MNGFWSRNRVVFAVYSISLIVLATIFFLIYVKERRNFPDYGDIHHFDPSREGGHLLPNLDLLVNGERVGQRVRFITNSRGFRSDREFSYEAPESTYRILFLGDSFVDGMRTDQENTIGYILEEILDSTSLAELRVADRPIEELHELYDQGMAVFAAQDTLRRLRPKSVKIDIALEKLTALRERVEGAATRDDEAVENASA